MTEKPLKSDSLHDQMMGKLALNYKMISHDQYIKVLELYEQEHRDGIKPTIQEVLVKHNFISSKDIRFLYAAKDILTQRRQEKRFGAVAVKQGLLRKEDIDRAVEMQQKSRKRIGEILRELNLLSRKQCSDILDTQKTIIINLPAHDEVAVSISDMIKNTSAGNASNIEINISEDELIAVAVIRGAIPSVGEVKSAVEKQGISNGVIRDSQIGENLKYLYLGLDAFIVARGKEPKKGSPGELILHFTPRQRIAGILDNDGKMDFRNRGDIPFAEKGQLLAERKNMVGSIPGQTIFGKVLEVDELEEAELSAGPGTEINGAGDSIFALTEGEPRLNLDGSVSVLRELTVKNVDFDSGNIKYDGNIFVLGKINPDFEVIGKGLRAREVLDARIDIEGDVEIEQGMIGATIRVTGDISATYIKNCKIDCCGTITVEKEIVDSEICCGGNCVVRGNILSSKICSGMSIAAVNIGSHRSSPNQLEIGASEKVFQRFAGPDEAAVTDMNTAIATTTERHDNVMNLLAVIKSVIREIEKEKTKNAQELAAVKELVAKIENKGGRTVATGRERVREYAARVKSATEVAKILLQDKQEYEKNLIEINHLMRVQREELEKALRKIDCLKELTSPGDGKIVVRSYGTIGPGTRIFGPNASVVLKNEYPPVIIREVWRSEPGDSRSEKRWVMEVKKS